jgi:hypothetical protein
MGGLGNQMFQYAAARSLTSNGDFIYFDHSFLEENKVGHEHFTPRVFELSIFENLRGKKAGKRRLAFFKSNSPFYRILRFFPGPRPVYVVQSGNECLEFPILSKRYQIYLDGYFQSEKYFKKIKEDLLTEFKFPELDQENNTVKNMMLQALNPVSVHIRRGDYVNSQAINSVHGVLPLSYYQNAINWLLSKYAEISLFIFSEDIAWAKENFTGGNIHFIDQNTGKDSWKDMALMTWCNHHIIANSSFSWWGAWLSRRDGEVIAPNRWFNPLMVNFNIQDILPGNWTILNVQ